jgi:Caspase domain
MRTYLLVLILISSFLTHLQSQSRASKTYALVIGVSKYEDPKITALKYAHQDAVAFSDLCISPSGLNIPTDQMRVLTDEKASYWNIVDGLDWLKSKAIKDDQIYIYFAGHGDMESKELKYGYLLAHDSRYMNYLGRSLSLDLLNKTAHTLTVDKKAKVFLITDACHSGKLAGVDFNGSNLVALNLMQLVSNNEVRITSCNEGELSYESEIWGDGRGAFSYFLTRGMSGEADGVNGKKDGTITIGEIKSFLSGKVPNEVRTVKSKKQNPVIMGTETVILNQFKPSSNNQSLALVSSTTGSTTEEGSRSVSAGLDNTLEADILYAVNSKLQIDFAILSTKTKKEILNELLDNLRKKGKYTKKTLVLTQTSHLVAKTLYDKVQHVIDLYLSGDEAELEKRRYYSQVDKPYDQYPYMIDIAIKLLPQKHILIPSLQMQREYLTGLAYRLKVPFTEDYLILIDSAYSCQQRALVLDNKAAYIHNEIGILELYKSNYEQSKYHFEKANNIAPLWSLPYANLASFYLRTKDDISAKKYVDLAIDRQQNLQNPYITDGSIYMNADNLLFAEEQYQRAIKINSRHFLPFEKLGELYLKTQNYELSNEYYYEAELRKLGLVQGPFIHLEDLNQAFSPPIKNCSIDSTKTDPTDIMATFAVGKYYFDIDSLNLAHRWFEKVINLDLENPLVYHYLGQTTHFFKHYQKAEFYFNKAIALHLPDSLFTLHVQEIAKLSTSNDLDFACLLETYEKAKFDFYSPNIYLARNYEKWGNFVSASEQYNTCIDIEKENNLAYYMLWNIFRKH